MCVTGVFVDDHICQLLHYISNWLATALASPQDKWTDSYPTLLPGRSRLFPYRCPLRGGFFFFFDDFSGVTLDPMTSAYKCISNLSLKNQLCANVGS